jgi:hypothetical protein
VDGLLQRVQRQETEAGLDGRLGGAGLLLMGEQVAQALDGQLVQALPLGREPAWVFRVGRTSAAPASSWA